MIHASCPREGDALRAARTGTAEEALRAHLTECAVCGEIVQASRWMQALAESPEGTGALPDSGLLWWRAQLSEKRAEAERAQKILDWGEFIFATMLLAGLAGWIAWNWRAIQIPLTSLLAVAQQWLWSAVFSAAGATTILSSVSVAILSLAAIVLIYPLLARD